MSNSIACKTEEARKPETMRIGCANACDDIKEDGSATLWHWTGPGGGLNEEYRCDCIYEMLTAKEMFEVAILDTAIEIERERFMKHCTLVESF